MSQITIRDLTPQVESIIRQRAAQEGISVSKAVAEMLAEATGFKSQDKRYRDLSSLSGTWTVEEAVEFEWTQEYFKSIDEEIWK